MGRHLAQVLVVPCGLDAAEDSWSWRAVVPADAKAVAIRRLGAEPGMEALVDQRVLRAVDSGVDRDGRTGVSEPAAHLGALLSRGGVMRAECSSAIRFARVWTRKERTNADPSPNEHERRRLRDNTRRLARADRRSRLRLGQEPRHPEVPRELRAGDDGPHDVRAGLNNERWPWPSVDVFVLASQRPPGTPDHVVTDSDPAHLLEKLRASNQGGDVHLVGGPRTDSSLPGRDADWAP